MAGAELTILVPVLGRPHRVKPLLASIRAATPDAMVLFLASPGDQAEIRALDRAGAWWLGVGGNYAAKINAGVVATDQPHIFLAADDLEFHSGWYEAARAMLAPGIGVVGTNDLCNRRVMAGQHSTHSLVARWYTALGTIDEDDKLLHEGYLHEYVDDEFVQTAMARGAYAHCHEAVVEHLHPMAGKAPMDEIYAQQPMRMRLGRKRYLHRRRLWMSPSASAPTAPAAGRR